MASDFIASIPAYTGRHTRFGRPHATDYTSWQAAGRQKFGTYHGVGFLGRDLGGDLFVACDLTPEIPISGSPRWGLDMRITLRADEGPAVTLDIRRTDPRPTISGNNIAELARDLMRDHLTALLAKLDARP